MPAKKKFLDFQAIKEAKDLRMEEIEVPEWGGSLLIRQLSGAGRIDFFKRYKTIEKLDKDAPEYLEANAVFGFELIASCLVDADGRRIMTDEEAKALHEKNPDVVDRVSKEVLRINGFNKEEQKALEKNSETSPSAGSSSG